MQRQPPSPSTWPRWAASPPAGSFLFGERKAAKSKALPDCLQGVLQRLTADKAAERYPTAAALLEDLDRAGTDVPPNAAAWDRLLRQVREQATDTALKQSA